VSGKGILLIAHDQLLQQRLVQAFATYGLPSPTQFSELDPALHWLEKHSCALCILDYDLPHIDGLRSLARIHQREPGLPVIMLSGVGTEAIAIAAFRAGVSDYVPKEPGFATVVAQQVRHLLRGDDGPLPQPIVVGPQVSDKLLQPTYQNRMRVIGREMDVGGYHSVSLLEVGGGFLVRATRSDRRAAEGLEFLDRDFPQLVALTSRGDGERRQRPGGLLPTGYEDLLRAIGRKLDDHLAESVAFVELSQAVLVWGMSGYDVPAHAGLVPFEWLLTTDDITLLLDEAYRLRAATQSSPGFLRRLARNT